MFGEEFGVFARKDVVGYGGDGVGGAERLAEGEHERGFAGADGSVCFGGEVRFSMMEWEGWAAREEERVVMFGVCAVV